MTHQEIQREFPHDCAWPRHLCRICRWVLDHRRRPELPVIQTWPALVAAELPKVTR